VGNNESIGCMFCQGEEFCQHGAIKKEYEHGKELTSFVCSACIQKLSRLPEEKLTELYRLAIAKGNLNQALCLKTFFNLEIEEKENGSETRTTRPSIVREKIVRLAGLASHKLRTKQAVVSLDKWRAPFCGKI
jgi:hypothetical protein